MKDRKKFTQFLDYNQVYFNLLSVASNGLKSLSFLADEKNLSAISSTLDFSLEHLHNELNLVRSEKNKEKKDYSSILDFFDNSQIYLEILTTCYEALNYYFNLRGDTNIRSVAITINFAIERLIKSFENFSLKEDITNCKTIDNNIE